MDIFLREGYYTTKYHKLSLRRVSLNFLCLLMTLLIVSIVILSNFYDFTATNIPFHVEAILGTILGALGASFSMSYTLTNESLDTKIPEQLLGIFVTILRLAIGSTAAFAAFIALLLFHSNLFKSILSADLLSSPFAFSIIAFVSGFSERFIVNMMSIVSNEEKSKDKSVKSS